MAATDTQVAAVFDDAAKFKDALQDLVHAGFDHDRISILAAHDDVAAHFGGEVPEARQLEDRRDAPRESLDVQHRIQSAIHALGEVVGSLAMVAAAGAAYAVGGPVGVASVAGEQTEESVEGTLERFVDTQYAERYRETLADGGLVCWVAVAGAAEARKAQGLLEAAGGADVHTVPDPRPPLQR